MPAVLIRRGAFIAHRPRQSSVRNECAPYIVATLDLGRSVGWGAQIVCFPDARKSPLRAAPEPRGGCKAPASCRRHASDVMGGEADPETVQWTVFPPNALRHAQGREIGRCPVEGTGRSLRKPTIGANVESWKIVGPSLRSTFIFQDSILPYSIEVLRHYTRSKYREPRRTQ